MVYFQKMTPQGYKLIEEEIKNLKKSRPIKIKALQEARSLGDLSENSEYTEAKKELRHLESRLRYLDKQLKYAEIITPNDDKKVDLGKKVKLRFEDDETSDTYEIVGRLEADLEAGKISFDSPLGVCLLYTSPSPRD